MSRAYEIENKLRHIIEEKRETLKAKYAKTINTVLNDIYDSHKITKEMREYKTVVKEIETLEDRKRELEKQIQGKTGHTNYRWEESLRDEALTRIPVFKELDELEKRISIEVLLATSGKALAGLFNSVMKELEFKN